MKRICKIHLTVLLFAATLVSGVSAGVSAAALQESDYKLNMVSTDVVKIWADGEVGEGLQAEYYSDGTLKIGGEGEMTSFESVISVPWHAYSARIENVIVEEGVTSIGARAFFGCYMLENVGLPASLTKIEQNAFSYCVSMRELTFPDGVTNISDWALSECKGMQKVTLPRALESLGKEVFAECSLLKSIEISEENVAYHTENGVLFSKDGKKLLHYPAMKADIEYVIPQSVEAIEAYAFQHAEKLEKVQLPQKLTHLGEYAFQCCTALKKIQLPSSLTEIGRYSFEYCTSLSYVIIPEGVKDVGAFAFNNCKNLEWFVLPASTQHVGTNAFYGSFKLRTVYYGGADYRDWNSIDYSGVTTYFIIPDRYYYSEIEPEDIGNYWRWADLEAEEEQQPMPLKWHELSRLDDSVERFISRWLQFLDDLFHGYFGLEVK